MKTDVLLIQPQQGEFVKKRIFHPGLEIPLNIACLAAYLDVQGIDNRILDMRLYDAPFKDLEDTIKMYSPRIVGISAFTSEYDNAIKSAKIIKSINKDILIVIGGHHAAAMPSELLEEIPEFDLLIHGEGELALTEIIRQFDSGRDYTEISGVSYRNGDSVVVVPRAELIASLDDLPFPARHKLDLSRYVPSPGTGNYMQLPTTGIMASRGCPYKCNYCSKGVWGATIRFRSVENVLAEVEHCIEKYGIHDYRFYDDALTLPQWELKRFCEEIIKRKLNITWNCYSRVNGITEDKLLAMKEAGCYHIKYGIEFGTEKALKIANKGATLNQARNAVALTKKVGIECKGNFMLGIPGETEADLEQTIKYAIELSPDLATFYPFDLFPGNTFYRRKLEGDNSIDDRLPREITQKMSNKGYISFYFRAGFIIQRLKRMAKNPMREIRLVKNGLAMIIQYFFRKWFQKDSGQAGTHTSSS
ncbi:MAG: radical SAM protein [Nitrospira sp.]|nr:radical SAM protein [bacterium]MBL7047984.1 radical SAM protein [Nitrospira sp.]